jgi:glycerol-3-phosphate cytidylyltransferase
MAKEKMLFLDDRTKRLHAALKQYSEKYDVTLCVNVLECLRLLSSEDWDVVSLDHDLGGEDFLPLDCATCGAEIVRYIQRTGWPEEKKKPWFWIHSKNTFAAHWMLNTLHEMGLPALYKAFVYEELKVPPYKRGMLAGAFDIIHPGYIKLFKDSKNVCDYLIIALHEDPSEERPGKLKPVLSVADRLDTLMAIRFVNQVVPYRTEEELLKLIKKIKPNVIIVGNDYKTDSEVTGSGLGIPIHYHQRKTPWSSTKLKRDICASMEEKK